MALLFDDAYHGPRWTYGLALRPVWLGNLPSDYVILSGRACPDFAFGTIDYPRELTDREVDQFALTLVQAS